MAMEGELKVKVTPMESSIKDFTQRMQKVAQNAFSKVGLPDVGGAVSGFIGQAGGGIAGILGPLTAAVATLGVIAALVKSSVALQKTLALGMKIVELILRPIGDMVAAVLRPLLMMLMPLVRVWRAFMQPFIQQINKLVRQGTQQIMGGDITGGLASLGKAVSIVFAPIMIAIAEVLKSALKLVTDIFFTQIQFIVLAIGGLGSIILAALGLGEARTQWEDFIVTLIGGIEEVKLDFMGLIDLAFNSSIQAVMAGVESLSANATTMESDVKTLGGSMVMAMAQAMTDGGVFEKGFPAKIATALTAAETRSSEFVTRVEETFARLGSIPITVNVRPVYEGQTTRGNDQYGYPYGTPNPYPQGYSPYGGTAQGGD